MKNHLTNYENAARERDLLMRDEFETKQAGPLLVVCLVIVAAPICAGLFGLFICWMLK